MCTCVRCNQKLTRIWAGFLTGGVRTDEGLKRARFPDHETHRQLRCILPQSNVISVISTVDPVPTGIVLDYKTISHVEKSKEYDLLSFLLPKTAHVGAETK